MVRTIVEHLQEKIQYLEKQLARKTKEIAMLRGAIDASWVGITIADGDGKCLMLNSSHHRITGLDPVTHIGKSYAKIENELNNISCNMEVVRQGRAVHIEQELGTGRRYMVYGTPYSDTDNGRRYIVCNLVDDIEVNRSKQELNLKGKIAEAERLVQQELLDKEQIGRNIIHRSIKMRKVLERCIRIAPFDSTVMLLGESGTGKELLADYIVAQSCRKDRPFIKVNCAAIPEALLESELFGYEAGSFTSARPQGKRGLFEIADKGTVMLDEISEMPLNLQSKLLRFLQEKEIFHIGGNNPIKVNVRIIAATNQDLEALVKAKKFRRDLYYRLNVVPIIVPPLRERKEDIPLLIYHFLCMYNERYNLKRQLSFDVIEYIRHKEFEGNVRELQNTIERILLLAPENVISLVDIIELFDLSSAEDGESRIKGLKCIMDEFERNILNSCLKQCATITQASVLLGISQPTLSRKLAHHKLSAGVKKDALAARE
ncbi:MAG: sigma 54-interacting transcriptional regulator [Desulfovibrio sp.]|jgi:transcriptional regulator with PAS, ATPase and Fis domain|nr:sigma 54-interacting transcriptional regulator [Desulfovibrio sp.]